MIACGGWIIAAAIGGFAVAGAFAVASIMLRGPRD